MYGAMTSRVEGDSKGHPGIALDELRERVTGPSGHLPEALFPGGAKVGWWAKTVHLDLEAKGVVLGTKARPIRPYGLEQLGQKHVRVAARRTSEN
jgi:hypothetical protein